MSLSRKRPQSAAAQLFVGNPWHLFGFFFLSALVLFLAAHPAFAQASGGSSGFSCTSSGGTNGTLYDSGSSCPTVLGWGNIFSFLVCNIEHLTSNLMGKMFCGMTHNLAPMVGSVITLAVVFFGAGFTIGVIPATARDFQVFLLKVSFIWVFATQSDMVIRYGYEFFVNGIRDSVAIALGGYNNSGNASSGSAVYSMLDGFLGRMIKFATDYIGSNGTTNTTNQDCKNAVFAVMAIMAIAFPPIFLLALALVMKLAITFVRAVFGYIYALVGITFLLTLAPIFLSFFLFKQTRSFFDKWIGYMVSFALQIVILFAFLSFILSIDVSNVSNSFTSIIIKNTEVKETTAFRAPWDYCTLCDFKVVDANGQDIPDNKTGEFLSKGKLVCKDQTNPKPIGVLSTMTPSQNGGAPNTSQQSTVLRFAGSGLISLMVLAYIIEALLGSISGLAQAVAGGFGGATYAPQLGGAGSAGANTGRASVDVPGIGLYDDFEAGLTRGARESNNSVGAFTKGFKEGMSRMVTGRGDYNNRPETRPGELGSAGNAGIRNRFMDWLVDPNHMDGH